MQHIDSKSFPKNKLFYVFENSAIIYFEIEDLKKEQDPFFNRIRNILVSVLENCKR